MNTGMSLIAIVALLLALAAAGADTEQAGVNSKPITPSKIVLNHNETLVRDTAPMK